MIDARTEEVIGGGTGKQHSRTPRNLPRVEFKLGVSTIGNHPKLHFLCGFWGFFRDDDLFRVQRLPHPVGSQIKFQRLHLQIQSGPPLVVFITVR